MKCCLTLCGNDIFEQSESRVEVKTVLPTRFDGKNFLVSWNRNGEAIFHLPCWQRLLKSKPTTNYKKLGAKRSRLNSSELVTKQEKSLIREAKKTAEFFDSAEQIKKEASRVAGWLLSAKHCVVFTGAGISTAAGIGDYRGKSGKWTEMDHEQVSDKIEQIFDMQGPSPSERCHPEKEPHKADHASGDEDQEDRGDEGVDYEELRPTFTHEALCRLVDLDLVKHVVSQNGDGLHGLSGISKEHLSELHGNVFIEKCEKCHHRYERTFYVMDDTGSQYFEDIEDYGKSEVKKPRHAKRCDTCGLSHRTGRKCEQKGCKGFLKDTIINFGDNLEEEILNQAFEHAQRCDLMICLGSTLTVTPANELVEVIQKTGRLVICNRQKTDYDDDCLPKFDGIPEAAGCRVYGDCDTFIREILKNVIGDERLKSWEGDRPQRIVSYEKNRCQMHSE